MKIVRMRKQVFDFLQVCGSMIYRGWWWGVLDDSKADEMTVSREIPGSDIKETVKVVLNREKT